MALAISMLGIGDVRHAASTRATAEGRNVPAQVFFRFRGGDWMLPIAGPLGAPRRADDLTQPPAKG
jgi:hypothetical protein